MDWHPLITTQNKRRKASTRLLLVTATNHSWSLPASQERDTLMEATPSWRGNPQLTATGFARLEIVSSELASAVTALAS